MPYKDYNKRLIHQKEYSLKNKEKIKIKGKKYYQENKKEIDKYNKEYRIKNRAKINENKKKYRARIKKEVLSFYSKGKLECRCCKEDIYEFLTIEHINGNGAQHRKEMPSSNIYLELKKNKFPKGYEVLCYNCNCAKGVLGKCPHYKLKE
jgi:hypothetical protein